MMVSDEELRDIERIARKAKARQSACCLLHADCADAIPGLVAEIKRLRKLEQAVAGAWESTQRAMAATDAQPPRGEGVLDCERGKGGNGLARPSGEQSSP